MGNTFNTETTVPSVVVSLQSEQNFQDKAQDALDLFENKSTETILSFGKNIIKKSQKYSEPLPRYGIVSADEIKEICDRIKTKITLTDKEKTQFKVVCELVSGIKPIAKVVNGEITKLIYRENVDDIEGSYAIFADNVHSMKGFITLLEDNDSKISIDAGIPIDFGLETKVKSDQTGIWKIDDTRIVSVLDDVTAKKVEWFPNVLIPRKVVDNENANMIMLIVVFLIMTIIIVMIVLSFQKTNQHQYQQQIQLQPIYKRYARPYSEYSNNIGDRFYSPLPQGNKNPFGGYSFL
jgi:hypothetical protein